MYKKLLNADLVSATPTCTKSFAYTCKRSGHCVRENVTCTCNCMPFSISHNKSLILVVTRSQTSWFFYCVINFPFMLKAISTMVPVTFENVPTTFSNHASYRLEKQFVQLARRMSLHRRKKRGNTMFRSRDLAWTDRQIHTQTHTHTVPALII